MKSSDLALIQNHLKKMYRVFTLAVLFISLIELVLAVRGLFFFNLERPKHRAYLYSYLFLFVTSLVAFLLLTVYRRRDVHMKKVSVLAYSYAFCLFCWSAFVSCLDCVANGDSGVMVYVMTCIAVGALMLIHPRIYIPMLIVSAAGMMVAIGLLRGALYSPGFYINFVVFLALAAFVNVQTYRISLRAFESDRRLLHLSVTDQLTGLYNRRRLDEQIAACAARGASYRFLLMDADDFKQINDTYGHTVGDECLVSIAESLRAHFGDEVYRFGGDEFAVITELSVDGIVDSVNRVNAELAEKRGDFPLHISVGICCVSEQDSAGTVFIHADRALYEAKHGGKGMAVVYQNKE